MSLYDATLSRIERNALVKHTHAISDEIDLLRTLIARSVPERGDNDEDKQTFILKAAATIARLEIVRIRTQSKTNNALHLALLEALNIMDSEEIEETPPCPASQNESSSA